MTLADLWKYIKGSNVLLVETNGIQVPAFETHKYMKRFVDSIRSLEGRTYVYLKNEEV
jgi:hypothetical protein